MLFRSTAGADPEYEEQILPLAARELAGARRVLDIGCGDGQVSRLANRLGAEVWAIDPTWNCVSVANERGGAVFARAGAGALPFASASFDAVVACLVFEHIREVDDAIAEARARLAQNPQDADTLSALGELLVLEAQGTVTPEAREALAQALKLKPADPRAGYYLGLAEAQAGEAKAAIARWLAIATAAPADAPYLAMLNAEIARVAKDASLPLPELKMPRGAPPEASAKGGPTREQVEAMGKLSAEDRQQAIRGMVDGLAEIGRAHV